MNRLDMIKYNKPKEEAGPPSKKFALCTNFNPGYPNIGKILHDHKHIFDLDPVLKKSYHLRTPLHLSVELQLPFFSQLDKRAAPSLPNFNQNVYYGP